MRELQSSFILSFFNCPVSAQSAAPEEDCLSGSYGIADSGNTELTTIMAAGNQLSYAEALAQAFKQLPSSSEPNQSIPILVTQDVSRLP